MTAPSFIPESNVEVLDLRHFSAADLRPLLEEETRCWAQLLYWDYRSSADMILRYIDAKILPGYAVLDGGGISGYCFFVYEGTKGVIGDLFVTGLGTPVARQREERILAHAIATLQQSPGIHRLEAQLLLHRSGTLASPFEKSSFQRYPRLFMKLSLRGPANADADSEPVPIGLPVLHSDIELRRWTEHDYQAAAGVISAAYQGHVDADINDQYRTTSGSMRFLNNIVRFPGCGQFDNGASFLAIHRPTRAVVGLVLCSRVRDDIGHVTQVCVVPDQRGRSIGRALLAAAARELQQRRFSALTLTVTEANRSAVTLYQQLGYRVQRVFDAFVWEG